MIPKDKKILKLFWSYGENRQILNEKSRFYVDMNLHVVTKNYAPGELVTVKLQYEDNDKLLNGEKNTKSIWYC